MMPKMVFYMVLVGLGLFLFVSSARLIGLDLNIFKKPSCNYNCICDKNEENDPSCKDCFYDFSDSECSFEEVQYAVKNLCTFSRCIYMCEEYWDNLIKYYEVDDTVFIDTLRKYNESYCCFVWEKFGGLPNFLKGLGYYCGKDYKVHKSEG